MPLGNVVNAASAAATASVNRDIVVIGASSGGIRALWSLLGALPPSLPAAVVVVVHMSPHDTSYLAETLQRQTELRVKTAEDGEPLRHGVVYVPVPDRHLLVAEEGLRLTRGPRESRSRPAVDALFRSAAVAFGSRVIGVVLTGYLDDGTAGLWAIKDRGGKALVQDPATAQAPSMPDSALHAVDPDFVGDPPALANEIARLVVSATVVKSVAMPSGRQEIENRIAMEENGFQAGVMKLGPASTYSCPSCHGVLLQIEEGPLTRFRCHTGHAYSPRALLAELDESIERTLWESLRAVEERVLLLRQMAEIASAAGQSDLATGYGASADAASDRLKNIESLLHEAAELEPKQA